jgi:hypothetical protein
MPDNRGFDGFFNEKVIKTYKCDRLLGVCRFAHKTLKNRRLGDFLPYKLRKDAG